MVLAQDAFPGAAVYHYGWYNALNVALFVWGASYLPRFRRTNSRAFPAIAAAAFGAAILVFAGVASGLMGPDTHTVIGAPGTSVRDADAARNDRFSDPRANRVIPARALVRLGGRRPPLYGRLHFLATAAHGFERRRGRCARKPLDGYAADERVVSFTGPADATADRHRRNERPIRFVFRSGDRSATSRRCCFPRSRQRNCTRIRRSSASPQFFLRSPTRTIALLPGGIGITPPDVQKAIGGSAVERRGSNVSGPRRSVCALPADSHFGLRDSDRGHRVFAKTPCRWRRRIRRSSPRARPMIRIAAGAVQSV